MGKSKFPYAAALVAPLLQASSAKNCSCTGCIADWGAAGCPDIRTVAPDLIRPPMVDGVAPSAGLRVRQTHPGYADTAAYHALYLPSDWRPGRKYPVIVEYMGNGPWKDTAGDVSTGRPEDANLGYGMMGPNGTGFIWVSMPFLTSWLGPRTNVSTYWWGCPDVVASKGCGSAYNATPTVDYAKRVVGDVIENFGGDPNAVILTGWSRGAIACGAIGLHDDEIAKLWRAFIPYSHLDGDCGPLPWNAPELVKARYARLAGRPQLNIGECDVATVSGRAWLEEIGVLDTGNFTFETTGFQNHNNAWILRPSKGRDRLRRWLREALR